MYFCFDSKWDNQFVKAFRLVYRVEDSCCFDHILPPWIHFLGHQASNDFPPYLTLHSLTETHWLNIYHVIQLVLYIINHKYVYNIIYIYISQTVTQPCLSKWNPLQLQKIHLFWVQCQFLPSTPDLPTPWVSPTSTWHASDLCAGSLRNSMG